MSHFASVVVIGRFEGRYAEEWLMYHLAIGFDQFFIYDNSRPEDGDELGWLAEKYPDKVTLTPWPGNAAQGSAYNHFMNVHSQSTEWAAFLDFDEFVVFHEDRTVQAFLAKYGALQTIGMSWLSFGHSGHEHRFDGLVIDNFCWRFPVYMREIKTLVKTSELDRIASVHNVNERARLINGHDLKGLPVVHAADFLDCCSATDTTNVVSVNHYFTRTLEDIEIKASRGSGAGTVEGRRDFSWYFDAQDYYNAELDLRAPLSLRSILKNNHAVDARVKAFFADRMRDLDPQTPKSFDPEWYSSFYPDVVSAGLSASEHFRSVGSLQGRAWNQRVWQEQFFSATRYLQNNPWLADQGVTEANAYYHFKVAGSFGKSDFL